MKSDTYCAACQLNSLFAKTMMILEPQVSWSQSPGSSNFFALDHDKK